MQTFIHLIILIPAFLECMCVVLLLFLFFLFIYLYHILQRMLRKVLHKQ